MRCARLASVHSCLGVVPSRAPSVGAVRIAHLCQPHRSSSRSVCTAPRSLGSPSQLSARPGVVHPQRVWRGFHVTSASPASDASASSSGTAASPAPAPGEAFPLPLPRGLAPSSALLLLSVPVPPEHWPSHLDFASPLLARASKTLKSKGVLVNAIYDGVSQAKDFPEVEDYPARLFFPDGKVFHYSSFSKKTIGDEAFLKDVGHKAGKERLLASLAGSSSITSGASGLGKDKPAGQAVMEDIEGRNVSPHVQLPAEIVICTHGSRDCRCSDRGGALVSALKEEIARRGAEKQVRVSEVAHVGGHKYAANAILLPSLDMLSNFLPSHAPSLLSHVLSGRPNSSQIWQHWRGRYGLTEAEQSSLWASVDPDRDPASGEDNVSDSTAGSKADTTVEQEVMLVFKTWEGDLKNVAAKEGETLLQVARREDLPSMEGVCGGHLECATCHLYLTTPADSNVSPPVDEPSEEEDDMLGYALGYKDGESRLGCQIKVTKELGEWCKKGGILGLPRF